MLLSEDIQPYIYASDGGDYVSSVEQLPWQYNKEIGIGPSTKDNPEPNYYITDAGLNAMSCQLGKRDQFLVLTIRLYEQNQRYPTLYRLQYEILQVRLFGRYSRLLQRC